jgi:hypothetical protein
VHKAKIGEIKMKKCEWCEGEMTLKQSKNRFCSCRCSAKWRNKEFGPNKPTENGKKILADSMKKLWQNPNFRANQIQRMKIDNPVYKKGIVEKAHRTRLKNCNGKLPNNFKYGNGKISPYELKVYDFLQSLDFYYNYAIPTKIVRDAYTEKNYAKNYKSDFTNLQKKICIEIDGYNHNNKKSIELDNKKDECLKFLGFKIFRFTHKEIDDYIKFKEDILKCLQD